MTIGREMGGAQRSTRTKKARGALRYKLISALRGGRSHKGKKEGAC